MVHRPGWLRRRKDPDPFRRPSPPRNPARQPGPGRAPRGPCSGPHYLAAADGRRPPATPRRSACRWPMSARRGSFAIGERELRPRRQAPPRSRVRLRRGRRAELVPLCCGSARPAVPGPRPAPPARLPAMEPGPDGPAASGPAAIREGWFRETCSLWPGQALSLQVEQLLHHRRSRYQDILVFRRYRRCPRAPASSAQPRPPAPRLTGPSTPGPKPAGPRPALAPSPPLTPPPWAGAGAAGWPLGLGSRSLRPAPRVSLGIRQSPSRPRFPPQPPPGGPPAVPRHVSPSLPTPGTPRRGGETLLTQGGLGYVFPTPENPGP